MIRTIFFVLGAVAPAAAQLVSFGVKAGVPITGAFDTLKSGPVNYLDQSRRYLIGPAIEVNLPFRLSVEADALARRLGVDANATDSSATARVRATSWDFPIMGKWRLLPGPVRPFVGAGPVFRYYSSLDFSGVRSLVTLSSTRLANNRQTGFIFGGGVELKLGRFRIIPELRYTRWGNDAFQDVVGTVLSTNKNQGDFVLGLMF